MAAALVKDMFGINERILKSLADQDEDWKSFQELWDSVKLKRFDSLTPDQVESLESLELDIQEQESLAVFRLFS